MVETSSFEGFRTFVKTTVLIVLGDKIGSGVLHVETLR